MTAPKSSIMNLSLDQINNLLIVTPPKPATVETQNETKGFNYLDEDVLGKDFLKYDELNKDYLKEYNKLDRNFLDSDFLVNLLDVSSSQLLTNELVEFNALLPKYNAATGLKFYIEDDFVTMFRDSFNAYAQVSVPISQSVTMKLTQDGVDVTQTVNSSGTTTITIKQGN
jgi:hypothetical protein